MSGTQALPLLVAVVIATVLSASITWATRPLLLRYTLVKPNPRSSHHLPPPQGAGIAVITATLSVSAIVAVLMNEAVPAVVFAATLLIAVLGLADDLKSIPVLPRLLLQATAVGAIVFTAPADLRIIPACPLAIERALLLLAGLWFVNLVNFMDGLDLMTVAEAVPITGAMVLLGWIGQSALPVTIVSAALCGAMAGFAPFNRPVAKVFLGDVGSLPIGLLLGWCLLELAFHQQLTAALLLPLYYLSDATLTLVGRLIRAEPFWAAHRSHFYQRATNNGFSVLSVISEVATLNVFLAVLAVASTQINSVAIQSVLLAAGCTAVALVLYRFAQPRSSGRVA